MQDKARTIVSFNVWHFRKDREKRAQRIGEDIKSLNPDIVLLQEIPFDEHGDTSDFLHQISEESGLAVAHSAPFQKITKDGAPYMEGLAILSNLPILEIGIAKSPKPDKEIGMPYQSSYAVFEDNEKTIVAFNVHGAWGGHKGHNRDKQFKKISQHADELEKKYSETNPVIVLGGDFNTEPDSSVIRYLKGLQPLGNHGAYWVDAWEQAGEGEGITSSPKLKYFHDTALFVGIAYPEFSPARRIDYIFTKGWNYGRRGMAIQTKLCFDKVNSDGYTPSDHFGVVTKLWCP